jgi:hypothetical protein
MNEHDLFIRWTLDMMHYGMNFVKNILKPITSEKDNIKVRCDLQRKGIRPHLWLTTNPRRAGRMLKLVADYVLLANEFESFAIVIKNVKTPLGHVLTMAQFIGQKVFGGLKSHDYHVVM